MLLGSTVTCRLVGRGMLLLVGPWLPVRQLPDAVRLETPASVSQIKCLTLAHITHFQANPQNTIPVDHKIKVQ